MKKSQQSRRLSQLLLILATVVIVLMPFHAFLTVSLSALVGHYTVLRLWKEAILLCLTAGAGVVLYKEPTLWRPMVRSWLIRLIVGYGIAQLILGVIALSLHAVGLRALAYGWLSAGRYLLFFIDILIIATSSQKTGRWHKMVFWPAAIVAVFGLLQYFVLPYDVLRHVGYSTATIFPYEDINHNIHYIRIMSTLRGANPLGAYLVVVACLLMAVRQTRRLWWYLLAAGSLLALILTFSRAAWLGLGVGIGVLLWSNLLHSAFRRHARHVLPAVAGTGLLVLIAGVLLLRSNTAVQNIILHTQNHSAVKTTSDQGHAAALRAGLRDVVREPFGRGPGTAGPASVYNTGHSIRIAEDYYVQIAQEVGWLGLAFYLAVLAVLAAQLWRRRADPLALGLLASLAGISVINLVSHAWTDDTLAYVWWGLAGFALAPAFFSPHKETGAGNYAA